MKGLIVNRIHQWNPQNQPLSCWTDTSNNYGFSVHSKIIAINNTGQIIALVSHVMGGTKSKSLQNPVKISGDNVRPTRPTLCSSCPVY